MVSEMSAPTTDWTSLIWISALSSLLSAGLALLGLRLWRRREPTVILPPQTPDVPSPTAPLQHHQQQKIEALVRLSGGLAHDLSDRMTALIGRSQLLLADEQLSATARRLVLAMQDDTLQAIETVEQLGTFARERREAPRPIRWNQHVRDMERYLLRMLRSDIELDIRLADQLPLVLGVPSTLNQCLVYLALNAAEAMPRGGRIRVETLNLYAFPPQVLLRVCDEGRGMGAQELECALDPYYSGGGGAGLGLSFVHGAVRGMGGSLQIESEPGQGTTVTIAMPAAAEHLPEAREPARTDSPRGEVLLVDDDASLRSMARQMLELMGMRVFDVEDGAAALEALSRDPGRFDAIVSDIVMPQINGMELTRQIRRRGWDVPVVLCTGYSLALEEAQSFHSLDVGALLAKPFAAEELREAIAKAQAKAGSRPTAATEPRAGQAEESALTPGSAG